MAKKQHSGPSGLVIVDKPQGITSHDVVSRVRRLARTSRVGHAGTLDPMATGLLILGVGKATKLLTWVTGESKTYRATIRLGASTVTDDAEGDIIEIADAGSVSALTSDRIDGEIEKLTGDIWQVPSSVSAIKVNGVRSYARVRSGEEVQLSSRKIRVAEFTVHSRKSVQEEAAGSRRYFLDLDVTVQCSAGTYVRALARDLGIALGVGGHLTALRRTSIGTIDLSAAYSLSRLSHKVEAGQGIPMISLDDAAAQLFPIRRLDAQQATDLSNGRRITPSESVVLPANAQQTVGVEPALVTAAYTPDGHLLALIENKTYEGQEVAAPMVVFEAGKQFSQKLYTEESPQ